MVFPVPVKLQESVNISGPVTVANRLAGMLDFSSFNWTVPAGSKVTLPVISCIKSSNGPLGFDEINISQPIFLT